MTERQKQNAFDRGRDGHDFYPVSMEEREEYDRGMQQRTRDLAAGAFAGEAVGGIIKIIFYLRPVYVFLLFYSGFIAAGYFTCTIISVLMMGRNPTLGFYDLAGTGISLFFIAFAAYFYYCLFEYFRGNMIENSRHNGQWRLFYLFGLLVRIAFPPLAAILFLIFIAGGDSEMAESSRGISGGWPFALALVISVAFVYKVSKKVNLFAPNITPLGAWAFNLGRENNAFRKGKKAPIVKKEIGGRRSVMLFMSSFAICAYSLLFLFSKAFTLMQGPTTIHTFDREPIMVMLVDLVSIYLSWLYTKNRADFFYRYDIHLWADGKLIRNALIVLVFSVSLPVLIAEPNYVIFAPVPGYLVFLGFVYIRLKGPI